MIPNGSALVTRLRRARVHLCDFASIVWYWLTCWQRPRARSTDGHGFFVLMYSPEDGQYHVVLERRMCAIAPGQPAVLAICGHAVHFASPDEEHRQAPGHSRCVDLFNALEVRPILPVRPSAPYPPILDDLIDVRYAIGA